MQDIVKILSFLVLSIVVTGSDYSKFDRLSNNVKPKFKNNNRKIPSIRYKQKELQGGGTLLKAYIENFPVSGVLKYDNTALVVCECKDRDNDGLFENVTVGNRIKRIAIPKNEEFSGDYSVSSKLYYEFEEDTDTYLNTIGYLFYSPFYLKEDFSFEISKNETIKIKSLKKYKVSLESRKIIVKDSKPYFKINGNDTKYIDRGGLKTDFKEDSNLIWSDSAMNLKKVEVKNWGRKHFQRIGKLPLLCRSLSQGKETDVNQFLKNEFRMERVLKHTNWKFDLGDYSVEILKMNFGLPKAVFTKNDYINVKEKFSDRLETGIFGGIRSK